MYDNEIDIHVREGNYDLAIQEAEEAIRSGLGDEEIYFWRGEAHRQLGNFEQALMDFDKAIRLGMYGFEVHDCRGFTHFKLGHYARAVEDLDQAIEYAKTELPEEYQLTDFYNITDDYLRVIVARTHLFRGVSHLQLANYDQAIRDFSYSIQSEPESPDSHWYRGEAYSNLGFKAKAQADFDKAAELSRQGYYPLGRSI